MSLCDRTGIMVMAEVKLEHCRHGTEGCFVSPGDVREVRER